MNEMRKLIETIKPLNEGLVRKVPQNKVRWPDGDMGTPGVSEINGQWEPLDWGDYSHNGLETIARVVSTQGLHVYVIDTGGDYIWFTIAK